MVQQSCTTPKSHPFRSLTRVCLLARNLLQKRQKCSCASFSVQFKRFLPGSWLTQVQYRSIYKKLPYQPPMRDPGKCRVIGGNGKPLDLKRLIVLPVILGTILLWHEFGVVPNLPLEVLINSDIISNYQCSLLYQKNNQKKSAVWKRNLSTL